MKKMFWWKGTWDHLRTTSQRRIASDSHYQRSISQQPHRNLVNHTFPPKFPVDWGFPKLEFCFVDLNSFCFVRWLFTQQTLSEDIHLLKCENLSRVVVVFNMWTTNVVFLWIEDGLSFVLLQNTVTSHWFHPLLLISFTLKNFRMSFFNFSETSCSVCWFACCFLFPGIQTFCFLECYTVEFSIEVNQNAVKCELWLFF